MREGVRHDAAHGRGPRRTPCRLPACRRKRRHVEGRVVSSFGAGPIGLLTMMAARLAGDDGACGRGHRRGAARGRDAPWRRRGHRRLRRRTALAEPCADRSPSTSSSRFPAALRALAPRSALCAAAAPWCRSATFRAGPCPSRRTPSWPSEIDLKGSFRFGREFEEAVAPDRIGEGRRALDRHGGAPALGGPDAFRLALDRSQSVKVC